MFYFQELKYHIQIRLKFCQQYPRTSFFLMSLDWESNKNHLKPILLTIYIFILF